MTRTLIVDGNHLLHRSMRVDELKELESHLGRPTGGIFGSLRSIHGTLGGYRANRCIVVYDGGISKRRREEYPEYKGPRYRDKDDPMFVEQDEESKSYSDKFDYQRSCLLHLLPKLGVKAWRFDGWEADDVIAALVDYFGHSDYNHVCVMSDDKDMLQLVQHNDNVSVNVFRAIAKQTVTASNFEQIFGCGQQEYELRRIIKGDPGSDNIGGIYGVGKKTIDDIFDEADGKIPYEYPFFELLEFCEGHKNKRIRKVADNINTVIRNHELMWLGLEDWSSLMPEIDEKMGDVAKLDLSAAKKLLTKLDMWSILKDMHTWIIPFMRLESKND